MSASQKMMTLDLLSKAHSSDQANRIYSEKIQHRSLHLRPSSPPPSELNARAARRKARQAKKEQGKQKPKPISARSRRKLGLYEIPKDHQKYDTYEPLNKLWQGYMREILGNDLYGGGSGAAAKLASAEYHGAHVEVVRSRCVDRVGIKGIVVRDRKFVLEIVTEKKGLKMVPKESTTFRVEVPVLPEQTVAQQTDGPQPEDESPQQRHTEGQIFAFEVLGDQMRLRSADRANRKFKAHFLPDL